MRASIFVFILPLILLIACGGDSDSPPATTPGTTITASDPYITGARFYWDQDDDRVRDSSEPLSTYTDVNGKATFSQVLPSDATIVQLDNGISGGFTYPGILSVVSDGSSSVVLSPLTTLKANCFTNVEILGLLKAASPTAYNGLTESDLFQDPMTFKDQSLMQANLSVANALLKTQEKFYFNNCPESVAYSGLGKSTSGLKADVTANTNIFASVLKDFATNKNLAAQRATSFSNLIQVMGNALNSTQIDQAITAFNSAAHTINQYSPVVISEKSGGFEASQKKSSWFDSGTYFDFSFGAMDYFQRVIAGRVADYGDAPLSVGITVLKYVNNKDTGIQLGAFQEDEENYQASFSGGFSSQAATYNIKQSYINKDGQKPEGWNSLNGAPTYTSSFSSDEYWRALQTEVVQGTTTHSLNYILGSGNEIEYYYGIDAPGNSTNPDQWLTNYSRRNNCIKKQTPPEPYIVVPCPDPALTGSPTEIVQYDALTEQMAGPTYRTLINESTKGILGLKPPRLIKGKISAPSCYPGSQPVCDDPPAPDTPFEIGFKDGTYYVEGAILFAMTSNDYGENQYFSIKPNGLAEGASVTSSYPDFFVEGRECIYQPVTMVGNCNPGDSLKVWAINKLDPVEGDPINLTGRSGFFRNGFLFLDISNIPELSEFQYIVLDLNNRKGFGIVQCDQPSCVPKTVYDSNGNPKFSYKGISTINIEQIDWGQASP